jgi:hypothetical protein
MEFLSKLNLKPGAILKITGIVFLAVIALVFLFRILGASFKSLTNGATSKGYSGMAAFDSASFSSGEEGDGISGGMALSKRNVELMIPQMNATAGDTAENFEVTNYNGTIETNRLDQTCQIISDLKVKDYVIFESSNRYDHGCNFNFKVKQPQANEVLDVIKGFDPKDLVTNTETIKRLVDDFTSETEILQKKKAVIESTLENAIESYDEISKLATQVKDVESLSNIITSKINIIERLSQERISVSEQLDRLSRSKADQLDRLEYVYFNLNVYENKFIDSENLKDSWKAAVKNFVNDVNRISQEVSIGLAVTILMVIQYLLYIIIILITAKLGWKLAKYIWKR